MAARAPEGEVPTGKVTLAFTDVEGSTTLWERCPDGMREGLALHDRILREAIAACGGYEVKTEGDAFIVAFAAAGDALRWCLRVQKALLDAPWPEALLAQELAAEQRDGDGRVVARGFRVRMGLHTGEPDCRVDPVTGRMDYFGPPVNRAARVSHAAHGGQVLVSDRAWAEASAAGAAAELGETTVVDLGEHRLKGLESTERLRQVLPRALASRRFPPLNTLDARKTNLAPHPTRFIGRIADLAAIHALLADGERLVTLLGPGGTGKTRLVSRAAALELEAFSRDGGGVWFCDLTEARSVDGVIGAVGSVLGLTLLTGRDTADLAILVGKAIAARGRMLLVLDNFEQVIGAAAPTVGLWLKLAPDVRFLVTSRELLKIPGERVHELGPLALPAAGDPGASEAVQLFVERARAVRPGWQPSAADLGAIGEVVRRLDGLALAIELAAARMNVMSVASLRDRLSRRFDLLSGARRDATDRQATLRGAIDWSWKLLTPKEQSELAQCSVFAGGFTMDALEAVLDLSGFEEPSFSPDVVQALKEKSLLRAQEVPELGGEIRFGMYESIREYAAERLRDSGKEARTLAAHAAYYRELGRELGRTVTERVDPEAIKRLSIEQENLLAIRRRALESPASVERTRDLLTVTLALDSLLGLRGPWKLHHQMLDESIEAAGSGAGVEPLLLRALHARGSSLLFRGRWQDAGVDFERALGLSRLTGDRRYEGRALMRLARLAQKRGDLARAHGLFAQALEIHEADDDEQNLALDHLYIADLLQQERRLDLARKERMASIALARAIGDPQIESLNEANLGTICQEEGKLDEGRAHFQKAIGLLQAISERARIGPTWDEAIYVGYLGALEHERGDLDAAISCYRSAIALLREVGDLPLEALFTAYLGGASAQKGELDPARTLLQDAGRAIAAVGAAAPETAIDLQYGVLEAVTGLADAARARIAAAERPGPAGEPSPADQSEDVRFSLRVLKKVLAG